MKAKNSCSKMMGIGILNSFIYFVNKRYGRNYNLSSAFITIFTKRPILISKSTPFNYHCLKTKGHVCHSRTVPDRQKHHVSEPSKLPGLVAI